VTAPRTTTGPLGLDDDELVACVACGLCLPHCPTYRVTGLEIASPRGRIAAMRAVETRAAPVDDAFLRAMDECVQCRGCEAACPSGVQFGHLMEDTRAAPLVTRTRSSKQRLVDWLAYRVLLPTHWLLVAGTWILMAAQRLRLVPRRFGLPRLTPGSVRPLALARTPTPDAWLFTGCVMDAWMRDTHRSAARVMAATGARVAASPPRASCCGALHVHAGRDADARRLARRVIASMPGDAPIVVDSAGCGASMKEYGHLLGSPEAHAFAARVRDFSEWVVDAGLPRATRIGRTVVIQDPCHLRHVQKAHGAVRTLLGAAYDVRDTDDEGLCCGAGGAYAVSHPDLAYEIRARKIDALERASAGARDAVVASANPGCLLHLRAAGVDARHPADLYARALEDDRGDG
jgi:glycolate oxidase iron-sulfur subunit